LFNIIIILASTVVCSLNVNPQALVFGVPECDFNVPCVETAASIDYSGSNVS